MTGRISDARQEPDDEVRFRHADTCQWQHSLAQIVQALLDAGLTPDVTGRAPQHPWQLLPQMIRST